MQTLFDVGCTQSEQGSHNSFKSHHKGQLVLIPLLAHLMHEQHWTWLTGEGVPPQGTPHSCVVNNLVVDVTAH